MARAFVLVMDSLGVGATADAQGFGDSGANTLGHIAAKCSLGEADVVGVRQGPLQIPNLLRLGMGRALNDCYQEMNPQADAKPLLGLPSVDTVSAAYGYCAELSSGKDTPSGHWEMMGLPVEFEWTCFPDTTPSFPEPLTEALIERAGLPGILGNCHSSGTVILCQHGEEHIRTGKPIVYTSADSVLQIAAHEVHFGLDRLMAVCKIARELADNYNLGRVIARPFLGETSSTFKRTANRRDLTTPPHGPTLLDRLKDDRGNVIAIGKIADIFAQKGITQVIKADGNMALFDATLEAAHSAEARSLIFTNFVDFDMLYGHRRDVVGYAAALEAFDRRLPELEAALQPGDIVMISADHGCDPSWRGTDHTREHVPVLVFGASVKAHSLGRRGSFADIGQSLATFFGLAPLSHGESFL